MGLGRSSSSSLFIETSLEVLPGGEEHYREAADQDVERLLVVIINKRQVLMEVQHFCCFAFGLF